MITVDWQRGKKIVANVREWKEKFHQVYEPIPSPDGEKIAAVVEVDKGQCSVCINNKTWEQTFERISFPSFSTSGSFICLVLQNYEWTLAEEGKTLEETFDYAWNLKCHPKNNSIAFNIKKGDLYGVCLNGKAWDNLFFDARETFISPNGKTSASYVRVKNPPLLDIFSFKEGVWTLAVNGEAWPMSFLSVYGCTFSEGDKVAATVRLGQQEFSVVTDGKIWGETFLNAWEGVFVDDSTFAVPAKTEKGWSLIVNGKPEWKTFTQLWHPQVGPDKRIAAVVCTEFGKWTVAVNGEPWKITFSQAVLPPFFSANGKHIAALVREKDKWTVAIDGKAWEKGFERIWSPQFNPEGNHVIAKVEIANEYYLAIDGRIRAEKYERMWEPIFSPDGKKILLRYVKEGHYIREVLTLEELL